MKLLKRIKNLWRLSEYEILEPNRPLNVGDQISPLIKPNEQASIVSMEDPLDEFMKKAENSN